MNPNAAPTRYSPASVALHWLMLVLLIAVYALIELREFYPRSSDPREAMKAWHFTLGLCVFALVWVRMIFRIAAAPRSLAGNPLLGAAAKAVHLALYALMIAMPLGGWLILSAEGEAVPFFGLDLPPLVNPNEALAHDVEELHELGGTIGYWLIGAHAAASLFHHYALKDGLLARMSLRAG